MASPRQNLEGRRYHKLVVLNWAGWRQYSNGRESTWNCQCDCGRQAIVPQRNLAGGNTKSCGCIIGQHKRTHGATVGGKSSPEFMAWVALLQRCRNPKGRSYKDYGGRGISVCERWDTFDNFLADMGPRPSPEHSIDRRENNGNYEPGNCRWTTRVVQSNNRRSSRRVEFNGETLTLAEWERSRGLKPGMLFKRLSAGWPLERALSPELQKRKGKSLTHEGCALTIVEWAAKLGITVAAMKQRVEDGLTSDKVFWPGPLPSARFVRATMQKRSMS